MTIEEIDRALFNRLSIIFDEMDIELTTHLDAMLTMLVGVRDYVRDNVFDIVGFLNDDMQTSLTTIVDALAEPEALISFILDVEPGQEGAMLDLMQVLITKTFERGLII